MKINLITKERVINFRSFFIVALFVAASVFAALITFFITWLGALLLTIILALSITFAVIFFKKARKRGQKLKNNYKFFTFLLCALLSITSFASFIVTANNWSSDYNGEATVFGMIEYDDTIEGCRSIWLRKAKINGIDVGGRIYLSIVDIDGSAIADLESGTLISITATVANVNLVSVDKNNIDTYAFRYNIRYYAEAETISAANIVGKTTPDAMLRLRESMLSRLNSVLGEKNGAIAFGMLVGDRTYISDFVVDYFSIAGLGHILAVSGLHLSILTGFLIFILKKLRVNRKIITMINLLVVVFYLLLANFSPSILRASVMCIVVNYVFLFAPHKDSLNSLSLAFSAILAFMPIFMFELGFLTSFSAVLGIILFLNPIARRLRKFKFPKFLAQGIALEASILIGLFPIFVYAFKTFQTYSFIANLLMLPFIGVIFISTFASLFFAMITTVNFPLKISGYGIQFLDFVAQKVSELPYARIIVFSSALILLCYVLYFVMSRFVIKRAKAVISIFCIVQCILLVVIQNTAAISSSTVAPVHFAYSNVSVVRTGGDYHVVGDFWSGAAIRNRLFDIRVRSVKSIFVNRLTAKIAEQILVFTKMYRDLTVYFPIDSADESAIELIADKKHFNIRGFDAESANFDDFHAVYHEKKFFAYGFSAEDASILFVPFGKDYSKYSGISNYNIIRSNFYYGEIGDTNALYLLNECDISSFNIISATEFLDYAFDYKKGEVYKPKK